MLDYAARMARICRPNIYSAPSSPSGWTGAHHLPRTTPQAAINRPTRTLPLICGHCGPHMRPSSDLRGLADGPDVAPSPLPYDIVHFILLLARTKNVPTLGSWTTFRNG